VSLLIAQDHHRSAPARKSLVKRDILALIYSTAASSSYSLGSRKRQYCKDNGVYHAKLATKELHSAFALHNERLRKIALGTKRTLHRRRRFLPQPAALARRERAADSRQSPKFEMTRLFASFLSSNLFPKSLVKPLLERLNVC
jgi:hypothetical protein